MKGMMWLSYLKIASRNLRKKKVFSLMNIFGLVLGMSAFILILNYILFQWSYDSFHVNAEHIYRVRNDHYSDGALSYSRAMTYRDAGPSLKEDMPEIEDYTRMNGTFGQGIVVAYYTPSGQDVKFIEENVYYVDDNFLTFFTFPLLKGQASKALADPNSVVITQSVARKYFGDDDPVNKTISVNGKSTFTVTGVLADLPANSHLSFDILFPIESLPEYRDRYAEKWVGGGGDVAHTYVLLQPGIGPNRVEEKFPAFLDKYQSDDIIEGTLTDQFILQPLKDIHLHSDLEFEIGINGNAQLVNFLLIIAVLIILIAWMNYINLSTIRATERAKEVGIRKVVGAVKGQLVKQFLLEALLLNFISIIVSFILVFLLFPSFNGLTGLGISFVIQDNALALLVLCIVFLTGAFLSGLYPAFILSSFNSIITLTSRFNIKSARGVSLIKSLTVFQYAVSVALIAGTLTVFEQIEYMRSQDLGINIDQILVVKAPKITDENYFNNLKVLENEMLKYSNFKGMTASSEIPGHPFNATTVIGLSGSNFDQLKRYGSAWVDYRFIPLFQIQVLAGRNFSEDLLTDDKAVVINEELSRSLGFNKPETALGQGIVTNRGLYTIIGVFENYHQVSLKDSHQPLAFYLNTARNKKYVSFKINSLDVAHTVNLLEKQYSKVFPGNPFEFFFLDDFFNRQYINDRQFGRVFGLFSTLAIFITCLGLFNLSSITTLNRTKEIAVRKVFGASVSQILVLISKGYLELIILGNVIALPLIWVVLREWLSNYAFRINISWWLLATPALIIVMIATLTVSFHIMKAAKNNPVRYLRLE